MTKENLTEHLPKDNEAERLVERDFRHGTIPELCAAVSVYQRNVK